MDENQIRTDFARTLTGSTNAEEVQIDWSRAFAPKPKPSPYPRILAIAMFLGLVFAANVLTSKIGPVSIGFGLVVMAGTFAAGLTFLVRDAVQHYAGWRWTLACIVVGAGLSAWMTGDGRLAIASGVAFAVSETADLLVYTPLIKRGQVKRAIILSNTVGAVIDSVLFLWIVGFLTWEAAGGQTLVKVAMTLPFVALLWGVRRGVLRNRVRAQGA